MLVSEYELREGGIFVKFDQHVGDKLAGCDNVASVKGEAYEFVDLSAGKETNEVDALETIPEEDQC